VPVQGVGELERSPAVDEGEAEEERQEDVPLVADPEERPPLQEDVAERAAAERRDQRERERADEVHPGPGGRNHAGDRRHDDGRRFDRRRELWKVGFQVGASLPVTGERRGA
jgi:hypothetical protein